MIKYWVALFLAMSLNATANLLIKYGMKQFTAPVPGEGLGGLVVCALRNWPVLLGLFCFAMNVGLYAFALKVIPISLGYPFMAFLGFAIIATVAGLVFHERLAPVQWVGVVTVMIGVALIACRMSTEEPPPLSPGTEAVSLQDTDN